MSARVTPNVGSGCAQQIAAALIALVFNPLIADAASQGANPTSSPADRARTAVGYSLCGTLVPVCGGALIAAAGHESSGAYQAGLLLGCAGLIVGPSLGYFNGRCASAAYRPLGVRAGVGVFTIVLGSAAIGARGGDDLSDIGTEVALGAIAGITALTLVALDIVDISHVGRAIEEHDRQSADDRRLEIHPALMGDGNVLGVEARIAL